MENIKYIPAVIGAAMIFTLVACEKGPAEKAGESIDKSVDKASESMNKVMDNIKGAARDVKEKSKDTMDKMTE